jgi:hypothetical protein
MPNKATLICISLGPKSEKRLTIFIANVCCLLNSVLLTDCDSSNKKTISAQSMHWSAPTIKLWNYWPNILELDLNKSKTNMFTTKHTLERLYADEDWFSIVFFVVRSCNLSFIFALMLYLSCALSPLYISLSLLLALHLNWFSKMCYRHDNAWYFLYCRRRQWHNAPCMWNELNENVIIIDPKGIAIWGEEYLRIATT